MIQIYETTHLTKKNSNREMPEKLHKYVKEYNYITFSSKSERLVSLSTQVEPVVIIWNIGEFITYAAHLRLSSSVICEEVKINPNNYNYISVCGRDNFRLLKYNDDELVVYSNSIVFKESKLTVRITKEQQIKLLKFIFFSSFSFILIIFRIMSAIPGLSLHSPALFYSPKARTSTTSTNTVGTTVCSETVSR